MAWLVIRVHDNPKPTSWKAGDIVEVRSEEQVNAAGWGRLETLPALYRILVSDLDAARVKQILERVQWRIDDSEQIDRVRRFRLLVGNLPAVKRNALASTGITTITRTQAMAAIRDNDGGIPTLQ